MKILGTIEVGTDKFDISDQTFTKSFLNIFEIWVPARNSNNIADENYFL